MIGIYSFPHGITLNPREWLLEDDEVAVFDTVKDAIGFLNKHTGENHTEDGWEEYGIFFGGYNEDDSSV